MYLNKKIIFTGIIMLILPVLTMSTKAQNIELSPFLGYGTGARLYTNQGYLMYDDGMNYGFALSFGVQPGMSIETTFNHMSSTLNIDRGQYTETLTDLYIQYYTIGVVRELMLDKKVIPYGFFDMGMANYMPVDDEYESEQKFLVDLGGGLKIKASERVGFKLQARLHLPLYLNGVYFGGGTGGASAGVTSTTVFVQGDFTGSIYFVLK